MATVKPITTEEFDKLFDDGEVDVLQYFDLSKVTRPNQNHNSVTVDIPYPLLASVESASAQLGVTVQQLVQQWVLGASAALAASQ